MFRKFYKIIYLGLAFLCLAIGSIGVVLPVLPTTPFLLLASFFFAKGSSRFHHWFMKTKLYKNHLHKFIISKAMTLKTKICILFPVSCMLLFAFFIAPFWHAKALIMVAFFFKYYYFFFRIRTIKPEEIA